MRLGHRADVWRYLAAANLIQVGQEEEDQHRYP